MLLRIVEEDRELLTLDTRPAAAGRADAAVRATRASTRGAGRAHRPVDRRAELLPYRAGAARLGVDPQTGLTDVLGIDVQVRLVTQQSTFNPLASGAP